jgi:ribosome-associated toxin RatA of RatAB toxin-antitoxin module
MSVPAPAKPSSVRVSRRGKGRIEKVRGSLTRILADARSSGKLVGIPPSGPGDDGRRPCQLTPEARPVQPIRASVTALGLLLTLAVVAPATPSADAVARMKAGETVVRDLAVPDGGGVVASFFVAAPAAVAREVLWETERFPEFMPGSRRVRLLEHSASRQVAEMVGGEGPISVRIVSERRLEPRGIVWRSVGGDVKRNDGAWTFEPTPGGTLVTYQVHLTPRGPVPGGVVTFLQKQALPAMIRAVRRRIEARAAARTPAPPR